MHETETETVICEMLVTFRGLRVLSHGGLPCYKRIIKVYYSLPALPGIWTFEVIFTVH